MSIAFANAGASSGAGAPGYPSSISAGNLLLLSVASKYPTNGPATPSGWTLLDQVQGGHGSAGADAGNVYCTVFYKVADGTETGTLTLTLTGVNSSFSRIFRYVTNSSSAFDTLASTTGSQNTPGTSWSVTGAADPGIRAGDVVVAFSAINSDAYTYSAEAITATGMTFTSTTEQLDAGTGGGDDTYLVVADARGTAGPSSAAPVFAMTASGSATDNPAGAVVFARLRLAASTGTSTVTLDNVTSTGTVEGSYAGRLGLGLGLNLGTG